jgi:hypothetical protein
MNKSTLLTLFMIISGTTVLAPVQAQDELVYVAVEPCRIVDTRGAGGVIAANNSRNFRVSGTVGELAVQGGESDCLDPKAGTGLQPLAVSAYIVAVPAPGSTNGVLTAYPSNLPPPPAGFGATVNFAASQVIGNTTNITLCNPAGSCPADGEFAILARNTPQHVVIDVQGYFYPLTGDDQVGAGTWEGTGQGIYPDGTTSQITDAVAVLTQDGNFIYGTAQFTLTLSNSAPVEEVVGQLSGHIQGNTVKGLFGGCLGPAPNCAGGAIFEGKLTGDELFGTVLDLGDGSTGTLTLQRTSP